LNIRLDPAVLADRDAVLGQLDLAFDPALDEQVLAPERLPLISIDGPITAAHGTFAADSARPPAAATAARTAGRGGGILGLRFLPSH